MTPKQQQAGHQQKALSLHQLAAGHKTAIDKLVQQALQNMGQGSA